MHTAPQAGSTAPRLAAASEKLEQALAELERAVEHVRSSGGKSEALAAQLHDVEQDRARLAEALDAASERSERLEKAHAEVSRRLDRAIGALQQALGGE